MRVEGRSIERRGERAFLSLDAVSGLPTGIPLLPSSIYVGRTDLSSPPPPPFPSGYRSDEDEALRVVGGKRRRGRSRGRGEGVTVYGPISDCVGPVVLVGRNRDKCERRKEGGRKPSSFVCRWLSLFVDRKMFKHMRGSVGEERSRS